MTIARFMNEWATDTPTASQIPIIFLKDVRPARGVQDAWQQPSVRQRGGVPSSERSSSMSGEPDFHPDLSTGENGGLAERLQRGSAVQHFGNGNRKEPSGCAVPAGASDEQNGS